MFSVSSIIKKLLLNTYNVNNSCHTPNKYTSYFYPEGVQNKSVWLVKWYLNSPGYLCARELSKEELSKHKKWLSATNTDGSFCNKQLAILGLCPIHLNFPNVYRTRYNKIYLTEFRSYIDIQRLTSPSYIEAYFDDWKKFGSIRKAVKIGRDSLNDIIPQIKTISGVDQLNDDNRLDQIYIGRTIDPRNNTSNQRILHEKYCYLLGFFWDYVSNTENTLDNIRYPRVDLQSGEKSTAEIDALPIFQHENAREHIKNLLKKGPWQTALDLKDPDCEKPPSIEYFRDHPIWTDRLVNEKRLDLIKSPLRDLDENDWAEGNPFIKRALEPPALERPYMTPEKFTVIQERMNGIHRKLLENKAAQEEDFLGALPAGYPSTRPASSTSFNAIIESDKTTLLNTVFDIPSKMSSDPIAMRRLIIVEYDLETKSGNAPMGRTLILFTFDQCRVIALQFDIYLADILEIIDWYLEERYIAGKPHSYPLTEEQKQEATQLHALLQRQDWWMENRIGASKSPST